MKIYPSPRSWHASASVVCAAPEDHCATFVGLFERQARWTPTATAVLFASGNTDYAALNHNANQLARHLAALGVGRGTYVGVCLDRTPRMLMALLAVLKSGAAYVPLDPGFPASRLAFMAGDSGMTVVVAETGTVACLGAEHAYGVIDLDASAGAIAALDNADLDLAPRAEDPAYLIYTSGSTGQPNGVAVSHASLLNFLDSMRTTPGLGAKDVVAAVTTISFDIAGLELFLPLTVGARVALVPREAATDGAALGRFLALQGATVLQATPSTWGLLIESGWMGMAGLRAFCGGEPLPRDLADALLGRVDALWNLYGPTETTIWSTVGQVMPEPAAVTVGRPIANTVIHVLDAARQPVPQGEPGEIWIGGRGVAIGYHQRPELTQARFVPDPFAADLGARMYRSGDLGALRADGQLVHLGRVDQQVKIRGHRIEPGEIEAVIATHPAVRSAVVCMRGEDTQLPRLVAYVIYQAGAELTAREMRDFLRDRLPDYMVPSATLPLDTLPMTPNGKLDMRALPDPFARGRRNSHGIADGSEAMLGAIWSEILGIATPNGHDNFFELGGSSLLAQRTVLEIERRCGVRLPARALFFQTLRQVAMDIAPRRDVVRGDLVQRDLAV